MVTRKRRKRRRRNVRPGAPPGTIVIDKKAPAPQIDVIQFNDEHIRCHENIAVADMPPLVDEMVTWINIVGLGDKQIVEQVAERFDIHALAIEDVVNTHQRPKLESFPDHLYIVLQMPRREVSHEEPRKQDVFDLEQVSMFVGARYVLTWQERNDDCFSRIRERLRTSRRQIRQQGSDFLAYSLIDAIIDSFFPILNQYSDAVDAIEELLMEANGDYPVMRELHILRSEIRDLRRSAWSHRDVARNLMAYEGDLLSDETRLHLRDVADHTMQLVDLLETSRDSCAGLQELYMSYVSMRMNEVIKVLTIIATIFIPLGFVAGVYGMNFSHDASPLNMPETQWYYGYPFALAMMLVVALGMLVFFRHRGWIGARSRKTIPKTGL